ncbi:MAG: AI-2E family transporter [Acidobacteriota bacterium]|nr:AI-2E family transporter [Acidobacteriota bacterium]
MLIGTAAAVVVMAGLRAAAGILIPLVVASLLALIMLPIVTWLRARGIPAGLAVVGSMLVALLGLAGPATIIAAAARRFVERAPDYRAALGHQSAAMSAWLESHGIPAISTVADPSILLDWTTAAAAGTATLLSRVFLVLLITAFILLEAADFRPKLQTAFGMTESDVARLVTGTQQVYQFLWIKTLISAATGILAGLWTAALGIEFALLWGLAAFFLNYIPNVGSLIAAGPPVLLALLDGGVGRAAVVAVGYVALNLSLGSVLEPRLIGRRLGLSPLALLVSLMFWGWAWGPVGLLLSVPLTMSVKLLLENFDRASWLAVLISRAPDASGDKRAPRS